MTRLRGWVPRGERLVSGRDGALGPVVNKAIQDVLGWKIKSGDATGFVGALNQSFQLKTVEGAVVSTWIPRSYVVQSDLSGGITGAQALLLRDPRPAANPPARFRRRL